MLFFDDVLDLFSPEIERKTMPLLQLIRANKFKELNLQIQVEIEQICMVNRIKVEYMFLVYALITAEICITITNALVNHNVSAATLLKRHIKEKFARW